MRPDEKFIGFAKQFINPHKLKNFNLVRRISKNWLLASLNISRNKYPFILQLKNGRTVQIDSWIDILHFTYPAIIKEVAKESNSVVVGFKGRYLIIEGYNRGDIGSTFILEDYGFLNPTGRIVVDIGAGIAESSIYFALKGSKGVLGFEPYPLLYNIGIKNVIANNLQEVVTLVNAGCGPDSTIHLDPQTGNIAVSLIDKAGGTRIPVYSLRTIVDKFSIPDGSVLKVDCEGCEYDLLLNSDDKTLRRFDEILIEYHFGGVELARRLSEAGFVVRRSWPVRGVYNTFARKNMYIGYIEARRMNSELAQKFQTRCINCVEV